MIGKTDCSILLVQVPLTLFCYGPGARMIGSIGSVSPSLLDDPNILT